MTQTTQTAAEALAAWWMAEVLSTEPHAFECSQESDELCTGCDFGPEAPHHE